MAFIIIDRAEKDICEIRDYISANNPTAAKKLLDTFEKAFQNLSLMPNMGHINEGYTRKDILLWNVKKYIIAYVIKDSDIYIIRVLSSYRDIAELLD